MIKIFIMALMVILLSGCGLSSSKNTVVYEFTGEYILYSNDVGFSDPDNDLTTALVLALQELGFIKVIGISREGYDNANNGSIIAAKQLHYWGVPETLIGIDPSTDQRMVTTIGTLGYPEQNLIYAGDFQDIRQFPGDQCLDNTIGCGTRVGAVELFERALANAPKKVHIVSGGQVISIAEALRANPALFVEKVKTITILGRKDLRRLSGQDFGGMDRAVWAIKYIIDNVPDSIKLVETSTDRAFQGSYQNIPNSRIGIVYQDFHINSPAAFVLGLEHPYGVGLINGYSIIDSIGLLYAAFGSTLPNGQVITSVENVYFNTANPLPVIEKKSSANHFILQASTSQWGMMKEFLEQALIDTSK